MVVININLHATFIIVVSVNYTITSPHVNTLILSQIKTSRTKQTRCSVLIEKYENHYYMRNSNSNSLYNTAINETRSSAITSNVLQKKEYIDTIKK